MRMAVDETSERDYVEESGADRTDSFHISGSHAAAARCRR